MRTTHFLSLLLLYPSLYPQGSDWRQPVGPHLLHASRPLAGQLPTDLGGHNQGLERSSPWTEIIPVPALAHSARLGPRRSRGSCLSNQNRITSTRQFHSNLYTNTSNNSSPYTSVLQITSLARNINRHLFLPSYVSTYGVDQHTGVPEIEPDTDPTTAPEPGSSGADAIQDPATREVYLSQIRYRPAQPTPVLTHE